MVLGGTELGPLEASLFGDIFRWALAHGVPWLLRGMTLGAKSHR